MRRHINRLRQRRQAARSKLDQRVRTLEKLEQRQLLAVDVTSGGDAANRTVDFEVSADFGQTLADLDDIHLRTDATGNLEWSKQAASGYQDVPGINLRDAALQSLSITVKTDLESSDEVATVLQNLGFATGSIVNLGNIWAPGIDLSLTALAIDVDANSVVSTRELSGSDPNQMTAPSIGDSGKIQLNAPLIRVGSDAKLLSDVGTTAFAPGDINLQADANLDDLTSGLFQLPVPALPDISITQSKIELIDATIKGGNVTASSSADSADQFNDSDQPGSIGEPLVDYIGAINVGVGVAISEATSEIVVNGGSIEGRNVSLTTDAKTDARALVLTVYGAAAYGQSVPTATVDISNNARIAAADDVTIGAKTDSFMDIQASQNLIGVSTIVEKINVTLATGWSKSTAKTSLSSNSTVIAGNDATFDVDVQRDHRILSNAAAYGDGTLATGIDVGVHLTDADAWIDGTVNVGNDLVVTADVDTKRNDYGGFATVGTGPLSALVFGGLQGVKKLNIGNMLSSPTRGWNRLFKTGNALDIQAERPNEKGFAGVLTIGVSINDVEVRIGDGADVVAGGDVVLRGTAEDNPETSALSFLNSNDSVVPNPSGGGDRFATSQREKGFAAALAGGYIESTVDVFIGDADVRAGDDITVSAEASTPYEIPDGRGGWLKRAFDPNEVDANTLLDKFNFNLGIQNAFFSSWSEAIASAQQKTYGGMLNVLLTNTTANAEIRGGADVRAGDAIQVISHTDNDTINFVGSPIGGPPIPFNATGGSGVGGAVMVTGYINDNNARVLGGADVQGESLLVLANTRGRNIGLGIQGSTADGFAFNGAFTGRFVDSNTKAQVSNEANVTLGVGQVSIPMVFDSVSQNAQTLTTNVPQFNPVQQYDSEDTTKRRVDGSANTILLPYAHGLQTGDAVYYTNDASSVGGGTNIAGLTSGTTYFAIVDGPELLRLASTRGEALLGQQRDIGLTGTDGGMHALYPGFDPTAAGVIDIANDQIDLGYEHGLISGQPLTYRKGEASATSIGSLSDGATYYAVVTGDRTVKLAQTASQAIAISLGRTGVSPINLTTGATGRGHSLFPEHYADLKVPAHIRALDTNNDGKVDAGDAAITSLEITPGIDGSLLQTDQNLVVLADDSTDQFSGTGAITKSQGSAQGYTVTVDVISRQTQAILGSHQQSLIAADPHAPGLGIDSSDTIVLDYDHGFSVGDSLRYTSGGGFVVGGLMDRDRYVVTSVPNSKSFTLGRSQGELGRTFSPATAVSADHVIDLGYQHEFKQGDAVVYGVGSGSAAIDGLTPGQTYYVTVVDDQKIALNVADDGALEEDLLYVTPHQQIADNHAIAIPFELPFADQTPVVYRTGGGQAIGGLVAGNIYYIKSQSDTKLAFQLSQTPGGSAIELDASVSDGFFHSFQPGFRPSENVTGNSTDPWFADTIDLGYEHGLSTGDVVIYDRGVDSVSNEIHGLDDGKRYRAIVISETKIALAETEEDAESGRVRFFDATRLVDSDDDGVFDAIDVYTDHGYDDGDQLVYLADSALTHTDQSIGLIDGQAYTVRKVPGQFSQFQLLDTNNDVVALTKSSAGGFDIRSLVKLGSRIDLGAINPATTSPHFFHKDFRIELDSSKATGSDHSFRLALDPTVSTKETHGFGQGFAPSASTLADSDGDGSQDTIELGYAHGYRTGQAVVYSAGTGRPIKGLSEAQVYFAIRASATSIRLAETLAGATSDTPEAIKLDSKPARGSSHTISSVLRPNPIVDGASNTIDLKRLHGFSDGQSVVYSVGAGETAITPLVSGNRYSVRVVDGQRIRLLDRDSNVIDLDASVATGTSHRLTESVGVTGSIVSGNDVYVAANNGGSVISIGIAASIASQGGKGDAFFGGGGWAAFSGELDDAKQGGTNLSGVLQVALIVDRTFATIQNARVEAAGDVSVLADNDARIYIGAGAIVVASVDTNGASRGIAGSFVVNVIANTTDARITGSTVVAKDVNVNADATGQVIAIALSGSAASGTLSLAGTIAVNVVAMNTQAKIVDSVIRATGSVDVTADNVAKIYAFAGGVAFTTPNTSGDRRQWSPTNSVGAAIAVNVISNDLGNADQVGTQAQIVESEIDATSDVNVDAMGSSEIWAGAVGLAFNFAGSSTYARNATGFSVGVNVISTRTQAKAKGKRGARGLKGSDITIEATDAAAINALSGAGAFAGNASGPQQGNSNSNAVGVSVAVNTIFTDIDAIVSDTVVTANGLTVHSVADGRIRSLGVGAAGAESVAIAGNVTVNLTQQNAQSRITNSDVAIGVPTSGGSLPTVSQDAVVTSAVTSEIHSLSGGGALAVGEQGTAIGAAIAVNVIDDSAIASIDGDSTVTTHGGSVHVKGRNDSKISTIGIGIAGAGQVGVAGSISTSVISNTTRATIDHANVTALGNVWVEAENDGEIKSYGGAIGIGASTAGVGGSISVNVLESETKALVKDSTVTASAADSRSINIKDWTGDGAESSETVAGLAVIASSTESLQTISGAIGGSAGIGVAVNLAPVVIADVTHAGIVDSSINSDQHRGRDVIVKAHQSTELRSAIGAVGIGFGKVGAGIAANGRFISNDTRAFIRDTSASSRDKIYAGGNVEVSTVTTESIESYHPWSGSRTKIWGSRFG